MTSPLLTSNSEPWHGQTMILFALEVANGAAHVRTDRVVGDEVAVGVDHDARFAVRRDGEGGRVSCRACPWPHRAACPGHGDRRRRWRRASKGVVVDEAFDDDSVDCVVTLAQARRRSSRPCRRPRRRDEHRRRRRRRRGRADDDERATIDSSRSMRVDQRRAIPDQDRTDGRSHASPPRAVQVPSSSCRRSPAPSRRESATSSGDGCPLSARRVLDPRVERESCAAARDDEGHPREEEDDVGAREVRRRVKAHRQEQNEREDQRPRTPRPGSTDRAACRVRSRSRRRR